jgi:hypothetical protein
MRPLMNADRRWAVVLAGLLTALPLSIGAAEPEGKPELEATVRSLLRALDAPELARREEAEKKLIEIGVDILPLLPEGTDRQTAEFRQRLERIRNRVTRARDEAFVEGTTVTLRGTYRLSKALEEIEKQTGNSFVDYREQFGEELGDPDLELNFQQTPFWKGVDELLDRAGMNVYGFADQQAVAIVAGQPNDVARTGRAAYRGAFRIEPTKLFAERDLRQPNRHTLDLTLEVAWEPRLKPIALLQPLKELDAVDDLGQPVKPQVEEAQLETPTHPGTIASEVLLPLVPPRDSAKAIARLSGKMVALLPGGVETFRFGDLEQARRVEQRHGGAVVTLEQTRRNNAVWEVRVAVRFDEPGPALESHRSWIFNNVVYLESAEGQRHEPDAYETTRQSETEVGIAYLFDVPGLAGQTFVYETPTVLLEVPIEYELKNLPLP